MNCCTKHPIYAQTRNGCVTDGTICRVVEGRFNVWLAVGRIRAVYMGVSIVDPGHPGKKCEWMVSV